MRTFHDRQVPSAVLDDADASGESIGATLAHVCYLTLATIAKKPATIAAVNHARTVADKDRWRELCRDWHPTEGERAAVVALLKTMPGYCCLNDAASIAARL